MKNEYKELYEKYLDLVFAGKQEEAEKLKPKLEEAKKPQKKGLARRC